jgi:uncharacterized membrane protein YedE/YeeE
MVSSSPLPFGLTISPRVDFSSAAAGGALIAASSTLLMALLGKTAGCSGVLGAALTARDGAAPAGWRASFLAGLVGAGALLNALHPAVFGVAAAAASPQLSAPAAVVAGLLVGVGTSMGSGCTSGHGICGLPRLSPRSAVAVATFMATGALAAVATRGGSAALTALALAPAGAAASALPLLPAGAAALVPTALAVAGAAAVFRARWFAAPGAGAGGRDHDAPTAHAAALLCGLVFGAGLGLSRMTDPQKVTSFLNPWAAGGWDPSLAGVMGAGVLINLVTFRWLARAGARPILAGAVRAAETECATLADALPMGACAKNSRVDAPLVLGAALFGLGWGLSGVCPGPSIVSLPAGGVNALFMFPATVAGMVLFELARG